MIKEPVVTNRQSLDRLSCSFDKQDLRRFLTIIQERLDAAAELEIQGIERTNQTDEQFENIKKVIRSGFKIRPTITGRNGSELYGSVEEIFDSPNFPEGHRGRS